CSRRTGTPDALSWAMTASACGSSGSVRIRTWVRCSATTSGNLGWLFGVIDVVLALAEVPDRDAARIAGLAVHATRRGQGVVDRVEPRHLGAIVVDRELLLELHHLLGGEELDLAQRLGRGELQVQRQRLQVGQRHLAGPLVLAASMELLRQLAID